MAPTILELLSFRTFSSVWYWIVVALAWAAASFRPMGVPYAMIRRARNDPGLEAVARVLAGRLVTAACRGGAVIVGILSAALTAVVLLAFVYGSEFAQGVLLIALPMTFVGWLTLRTARTIDGGADPARHLRRLRAATNAIGLVALFLTAFWGMYVNIMISVL